MNYYFKKRVQSLFRNHNNTVTVSQNMRFINMRNKIVSAYLI